MSNRGTYPNWILPAVCVVFVTGVVAVGLGGYFFVPDVLREEAVEHWAFLMEKAKAAGTVVEERPEVRARLEQKYPGENFTAQDRITNGERALFVGLLNSQHAGLDSEAKKAVAFGAARLAFDIHPRANELIWISVHFSTVGSAGLVSWEENSDPYRFTPEELSERESASAAGDARTLQNELSWGANTTSC